MSDTLGALLADWPVGRALGDRLAAGLAGRGVRPGDRLAWQLANDERAIGLYRACWTLGAVAVPLHARAGPADVDRLAALAGASVVLRDPAEVDSLAETDARPPVAAVDPDGDAVVLFTAGSTGEPKGVRHTHRALAGKARSMVVVHGLGPDDAVLMPAPLAHISGLLNGVLVPAAAGMRVALMARWSAEEALHLIAAERISFMVGPPTFFVDLMDSPAFRPASVASLRLISSGGAGVAPTFVDRASSVLGATVKRSYGSTEAPTVATSVAGDDPALVRAHDGHAVGDAELRVDETGELQVRGPELFVGYLDDAQTATAMTDDGWFRTGDLATLSADGWLTITGRRKELIIRAGENISVREVEAVLEAHPAVRLAAALGEPDERLGERVVAYVECNAAFDLEACRSWFAAQGVARFKTPERVVVLDELPRLPAGKVDRAALRGR